MENKGAIVLAAGYSSRMGAFKQLLDVGGKPALERVLDALTGGGVSNIIVVTGHNRESLAPLIKKAGAVEAYNAEYAEGMFSSVRAGIKKWVEISGRPDDFLLMPVDAAAVDSDVIRALISYENPAERFAVPCYHGKKGHPLRIPARFINEILSAGAEGGLKSVTRKYENDIARLELDRECVVMDMDTREDYEYMLAYLERGCAEEDIRTLAAGRRVIFIRHGRIIQHEKKIFLGQSDVPLSEEGKRQAGEAASTLRELMPQVRALYCSDLVRAKETAEIISDALNIDKIVLLKELREMSLGAWDGRYIDDIKENFPREFEMRGQNPLAYKFDDASENFYDLRYRAIKALKKILKADMSKDIIIVTHSGVIRTVAAALCGEKFDEKAAKAKLREGSVHVIDLS